MDIARQTKFKILLVGDNGVDQYQYGIVNRISPEAPVPIIDYSHTDTKPGMAANVRENLLSLGCDVTFEHGLKTSIKTRIIDLKSKQQLVRIDQDLSSRPVKINFNAISKYDAIVISDYNKGSVSYDVINDIRKHYTGPIFIDTKKTDLAKLEGLIIKINSSEFSKLITTPTNQTEMIVTYGDKGAVWRNKTFSAEKVEVSDVCGAGDTFLAALAYGYINFDNDMENAIKFAIKASSVTVQHVGVYAPNLEEIK